MIAEKLKIYLKDKPENAFTAFSCELVSLLESAKIGVTIEQLISVIIDKESLGEFVNGIERTETKCKLKKYLEYDKSYYQKMVSSILPVLKQISA